jgi:hypothetical protein
VQACEAATATLSRPASPQESIMQPIPDKELIVRGRLEDLIDKVKNMPWYTNISVLHGLVVVYFCMVLFWFFP